MDSDPYYAILEASCFAAHWLPFCTIFNMEPIAPEVYFAKKYEPRNDCRHWLAMMDVFAQNMSHIALPLVGKTAYKPLFKDKSHYLVLHDDGSLQIYSYILLVGADGGGTVIFGQTKKLGSDILCSKFFVINPEFPLDFFEKMVCITTDVKLSGDVIRNSDS
ncbi:hypothetical protein GIB67_028099 [Kingdonia uniflora]|uniref:Uncharacterized protein n=1 Tax=Kingdonia uniflora TaxID=39325 RepID=A0A7J7NRK2_9MAGN|nr:hypothetical protein GIB67_028099 [Kingdonia uniflora]